MVNNQFNSSHINVNNLDKFINKLKEDKKFNDESITLKVPKINDSISSFGVKDKTPESDAVTQSPFAAFSDVPEEGHFISDDSGFFTSGNVFVDRTLLEEAPDKVDFQFGFSPLTGSFEPLNAREALIEDNGIIDRLLPSLLKNKFYPTAGNALETGQKIGLSIPQSIDHIGTLQTALIIHNIFS